MDASPARTFEIVVDRTEPVVVLTATGEIDAASVGAVTAAFDEAITRHERHVVLDAGGITFIDSTGVSALVAAMRRLNRTRRRMGVACQPSSPLGRALEMTGLDHTFDVHSTVAAAVASLGDAPLIGR